MSVEHKMDPKAKLLPWQWHSRYITGAKFEQHHYNIFQDILDFVIYFCTDTICDIINFLTKT